MSALYPALRNPVYCLLLISVIFRVLPDNVRFSLTRLAFATGPTCRGQGSHAEQALERLRNFILAHGSSRFRLMEDKKAAVSQLAGYRGDKTFSFTADGFKEACRGHNTQDVARILRKRGLLRAPDQGHLMERVSVPGVGRRVRLYAVCSEIVEQDERTAGTP